MIILQAADVKNFQGESATGHLLDPQPLLDGTFCLPEAVLTDPKHASKLAALKALPIRKVTINEFPWYVANSPYVATANAEKLATDPASLK